MESFKYFGSMLTNYERYTCEIKSRIATAKKTAFNKKRALFTNTLDLKLRKKLVKCYIWGIAFYGAENWTIWAVDQKHLESLKMLKKGVKDQLDRSCEKLRDITDSRGAEEYPT